MTMQVWSASARPAVVVVVCALAAFGPAAAQVHQAGDASLRVEYQYFKTGEFHSDSGPIDIGHTDTHALMVAGEYAIDDRWKLFASLPYIRRRHEGAFPHNAVLDFQEYEPPDLRVWDDGEYHGDFQDLFMGVSYSWTKGPFTWQPHISYGYPTTDYPFYANAAIGRNIWNLPVGVAVDFFPYFSDWHFKADISYVFAEKTLGVNTSHWLFQFLARYYITPRFAPKLFIVQKYAPGGLSIWEDFDPATFNFDSADWYYHDRTLRHNYANLGIGFDWALSENYEFSATAFKMIHADQINEVEYAFTVGLTRYFSRD